MSTAPTIMVFDVGAVLVKWDPDRLYKTLIPDDQERAAFFSRCKMDEMNLRGDHGRLEDVVAEWCERFPDDAHLIQPWYDRWREMCYADIPATAQILDQLKAQDTKVLVLSNFAADTFAFASTIYPVLTRFDGGIVSGEVGVAKPDPAVYAMVEEVAGARGSALYFADDRAENCRVARERGWHAHQFVNAEGLAADLKDAGLLDEAFSFC